MATFRRLDDVIQSRRQYLMKSRGTLIAKASNSTEQYSTRSARFLETQQRK